MNIKRVLITGPSGVGKTTLAKQIAKEYNIPFVSGSISQILPGNGDSHQRSLEKLTHEQKHLKNSQAINKRMQIYKSITGSFVSDRSPIDAAAYEIYENADHLSECSIDDIIKAANQALLESEITHIINIGYHHHTMKDKWKFEENGKRITNPYFQHTVTSCMSLVFDILGKDYNQEFDFSDLFIHGKNWEPNHDKHVDLVKYIPTIWMGIGYVKGDAAMAQVRDFIEDVDEHEAKKELRNGQRKASDSDIIQ